VLIAQKDKPAQLPNQGSAPVSLFSAARHDAAPVVLASGSLAKALYENAVTEWQILSSAALIGLGNGALTLGVEYAKQRHAFGAPIGSFQAVSHALVDAAIAVTGGRNLVRKAAWFHDNEPMARPCLTPMAFLNATRVATSASAVSVHVHGGSGYMAESDVSLYFMRAKTWSGLMGSLAVQVDQIAAHLRPSTASTLD
jgi:alkylation response protein AidB-like acyl-CoA dehydrogenase